MSAVPVISDDEVATLNKARDILAALPARTPYDRGGGMVDCQADVAGNAVFMVLNRLAANGFADLTYAQLHNKTVPS